MNQKGTDPGTNQHKQNKKGTDPWNQPEQGTVPQNHPLLGTDPGNQPAQGTVPINHPAEATSTHNQPQRPRGTISAFPAATPAPTQYNPHQDTTLLDKLSPTIHTLLPTRDVPQSIAIYCRQIFQLQYNCNFLFFHPLRIGIALFVTIPIVYCKVFCNPNCNCKMRLQSQLQLHPATVIPIAIYCNTWQ